MKIATGLILSAISGMLLFLSFPPHKISWLIWFALAPMFVAMMKLAPSRFSFGLFFSTGISVFLLGLIWGVPSGYEIMYAIPAIAFFVVFGIIFWQREIALKNNFRYFTALSATGFIGIEFARQYSPIALYGALGVSQFTNPAVIQIASLFGVYGITFMIVLSNCAIALLAANIRNLKTVQFHIALNVAIVAALMAVNMYLYARQDKITGIMKVASVQFGFKREMSDNPGLEKWIEQQKNNDRLGASHTALDILEPMTDRAAQEGAKLVVWPETIIDVDPEDYPDIALRIGKIAKRNKIYLVATYVSLLPGQEKEKVPAYKNMAVVISPNGRVASRYVKRHRVTTLDIEKGPTGTDIELVSTMAGLVGIMICYDADFPDVSREYAALGAEMFVIASDDLAQWLTRHHTAMQMFRSVEHRRSLVKADVINGAIIVDHKGRILDDPPDGRAIAIADATFVNSSTPHPWLSILTGASALGLFPMFIFFAMREKDRSKA